MLVLVANSLGDPRDSVVNNTRCHCELLQRSCNGATSRLSCFVVLSVNVKGSGSTGSGKYVTV